MAQDLTDTELDELDHLLAHVPEPMQSLDVAMLDGYLCGVLVQPRLVPREEWLPPIFDLDGGALPDDVDPAWRARVEALIERRQAALNEGMAEDGWFDPVIQEAEPDDQPNPALAELPGYSRPLFAWSAGFQYALACFPDLDALPDEAVETALDRVFRHLPPETDDDRTVLQRLNEEFPLTSDDEAVADLVSAVAELWDLTCDQRFRVATVRRDAAKVGRNDPCPCGSGRKFKHCHGQ